MRETLTLEEAIGFAYKVESWHTPRFSPSVSKGQLVHYGQLKMFQVEVGMHRVKWVPEYEEVIRPDCHYPFFNELVTVPKPKPSHLLPDGEWYHIKIAHENITLVNYESQKIHLQELHAIITDKLIENQAARHHSALEQARQITAR